RRMVRSEIVRVRVDAPLPKLLELFPPDHDLLVVFGHAAETECVYWLPGGGSNISGGPSSARALRALRASDAPRPRRPARALSRSDDRLLAPPAVAQTSAIGAPRRARARAVARPIPELALPLIVGRPRSIATCLEDRARAFQSVDHVRVADGQRPGSHSRFSH